MTVVKLCGLTSLADALQAVEAGADLLGFNFYPPSPRSITPAACARITAELRRQGARVRTVGVFVNLPPAQVSAILDACGLDLAQLHGDESPAELEALGERAFKALRPASVNELAEAVQHYRPRTSAPAYLLDAHRPGLYGGTGQEADWSLAAGLAHEAPLLLAGGLHPGNVSAALDQVRPWGVDAASGVEITPGRKDSHKVQAFVHTVRLFDQENFDG